MAQINANKERTTKIVKGLFLGFFAVGALVAVVAAYAVQMPAFQRMDFIGSITFVEAGLGIGLLALMKHFGKIK